MPGPPGRGAVGDGQVGLRLAQTGPRQAKLLLGLRRLHEGEGGLLGLPVVVPAVGRRPGVFADAQGSAGVLYLRVRDLALNPLGELQARPGSAREDNCKASCVDWYGNARPIFLGGRVFALLGYELVEGRLAGRGRDERLGERRRVRFAPRPTLLPGDVITTGTPPGVGLGMKNEKGESAPVYLKKGDVMTLGIDGLGEQRQLVVPFKL